MISCYLLFSYVDFLLWFLTVVPIGVYLIHSCLQECIDTGSFSDYIMKKKSSGSEFEIKLSLNFICKTCIAGSK